MKKRIVLVSYISLAVALSALENVVLPSSVIPGVKLGFANLVVLVTLYQYGIKEAWFVSFIRVIIVSLIVGIFLTPTFLISLSGMIFSLIGLSLVFLMKKFSVIGVSVIASVFHIVGQVVSVILIMNLSSIATIAPFLIYVAIISGVVTGYIAMRILKVISVKSEVVYEF